MRDIIRRTRVRLSIAIVAVALGFGVTTCTLIPVSHVKLNAVQKLKQTIVEVRTDTGRGSGVIVSEGGLILTNKHVISGGKYVDVYSPAKAYDAIVVYVHPYRDLAILWIHDENDLPAAKIAKYNEYAHGDEVFAIGNPLGITKFVSRGIVSKFSQKARTTWVWHDAVILEGSSGGGLFSDGKLIGINTLRVKQMPGHHYTGINLAIASRDFLQLVEKFKKIYG
jgi:S1-C subfamily serine protease